MPLLARRAAGAFAALRMLGGGTVRASGAVVFAYHDIDDDPTNATTYLATPDGLRAQLLSVISWGLRFVELGDLCDRAMGTIASPRPAGHRPVVQGSPEDAGRYPHFPALVGPVENRPRKG